LRFFDTFKKAFDAYKKDPTIYKISWRKNRWLPKSKSDVWEPHSEDKLKTLSKKYELEKNINAIYWVHQSVMPNRLPSKAYFDDRLTKKEQETLWDSDCLQEIITEEEFLQRFN
jgi:hypothetical protein